MKTQAMDTEFSVGRQRTILGKGFQQKCVCVWEKDLFLLCSRLWQHTAAFTLKPDAHKYPSLTEIIREQICKKIREILRESHPYSIRV